MDKNFVILIYSSLIVFICLIFIRYWNEWCLICCLPCKVQCDEMISSISTRQFVFTFWWKIFLANLKKKLSYAYQVQQILLMQIDELQKVVPYRKVFPDGYTVDVKRIGSQTYFKIRREGTIQTQLFHFNWLFLKLRGESHSAELLNCDWWSRLLWN